MTIRRESEKPEFPRRRRARKGDSSIFFNQIMRDHIQESKTEK
jgi:hypothetical protein